MVNAEPVEAHDGELCLIGRFELDDCAARWPVSLQNGVHPRVILRQLLQHQSTEVYWQVLDFYKVSWHQLCRLLPNWLFLRGLFNDFLFFHRHSSLSNLLLGLFFLKKFLCQGEFLLLGFVLLGLLFHEVLFLLKELFATLLSLGLVLLSPLALPIIDHFQETLTPSVSSCRQESIHDLLLGALVALSTSFVALRTRVLDLLQFKRY